MTLPIRTCAIALTLALGACGAPAAQLVSDGIQLERQPSVDRFDAADRFEAACRAGDGAGCFHFERLMLGGRPYPALYERGRLRWEAACEAGDGRACFRFGLLHDDEGGFGLETPRALELYERACELGYTYACQRAAGLYVVLFDYDISVGDQRALCERSCEAGFGRACEVLAAFVKGGRGGPRSLPRSRELLRAACARGRAEPCVRLAKRTIWRASTQGEGRAEAAREDLRPLVDALTPSCAAGHSGACLVVNQLLAAQLPTPDVARRRSVLESGCAGGAAGACEALMRDLRGRKLGKVDSASLDHWRAVAQTTREAFDRRALETTRLRCDDGHARACDLAASRVAGRDPQTTRYLRERAITLKRETAAWTLRYLTERCDVGAPTACWQLAGLLKGDELGPADPAAAARYAERAKALAEALILRWAQDWERQCDEGVPFGCVKLANALDSGRLSPKDPARVQRLRQRANALVAKLRAEWALASDPHP